MAARVVISTLNVEMREEFVRNISFENNLSSNEYHFNMIMLNAFRGLGIVRVVRQDRICPLINEKKSETKELSWIFHQNLCEQVSLLRSLNENLNGVCICGKEAEFLVNWIRDTEDVQVLSQLIGLLRFSNVSLDSLMEKFFVLSSTFSEDLLPVQLSLSAMSDRIEKSRDGGKVLFLLMLNDVALVRSLGYRVTTASEEILKRLTIGARREICRRIVCQIKERLEKDKFEEPLTFECDEFWGIWLCFPDVEELFWRDCEEPMSLTEMRVKIVELTKYMI
jgi:hypothetical protein